MKFPKSDSRFHWTMHIKNKMFYYSISSAQINRIFRHPERIEEGIAPNTIAAMQTKKRNVSRSKNLDLGIKNKKSESEEIWIMYKVNLKAKNRELKAVNKKPNLKKSRVIMISAWRYPGKTKKGQQPVLPEGLLDELTMEGLI